MTLFVQRTTKKVGSLLENLIDTTFPSFFRNYFVKNTFVPTSD